MSHYHKQIDKEQKMKIEDRKDGEILIVKPVEKRLDASVAVEFKGKMAEFIKDGNELIVLDLSDVKFMDSSGLGAIVSSLKALGRKGDLVISGTKKAVSSLFTITRMDRVFRMFVNAEEAVSALSEG